MSRPPMSASVVLRLGMACLVVPMLAACQYYAPNAPLDPDSTEAVTRAEIERLQDRMASRSVPPAQLRIPTGGVLQAEEICRDWLDTCWEARGIVAVPAPVADVPQLPASGPAAAQTFRGVLPCLPGTGAVCVGQQAVVTLFANQTWRARVSAIQASGTVLDPIALQGCWQRDAGNARQFVLRLANGNLMAQLRAVSNNQLVVHTDAQGAEGVLRHALVRQPDIDWLGSGYPATGSCATP